MKISHSLAFLVLILLLVAGLFFWLENSDFGRQPTLRRVVDCRNEAIDDSVLELDADTTLIGAFITFERTPLDQLTKDKLAALDVVLDEDSQIFETTSHVLAQIPTVSLCELSKIEGVKSVFIPAINQPSVNANEVK